MQASTRKTEELNAILAEALAVAAQAGKVDLVRKLLALGVDPNKALDEKGRSALLLACGKEEPSLGVIRSLLDAGADPNVLPQGAGWVCALNLVLNRETAKLEVVQALLAAGANPDGRSGWLLRMAVERCTTPVVRALVEAGAAVNRPSRVGTGREVRLETPLEAAARRASVDKAQLLIDAGAVIPESLRDEAFWEQCPANPVRRIVSAEILRLAMEHAMSRDAAVPGEDRPSANPSPL